MINFISPFRGPFILWESMWYMRMAYFFNFEHDCHILESHQTNKLRTVDRPIKNILVQIPLFSNGAEEFF